MAPRPTVSAPVHAMQRRSVGSVSHREASAAHPSMLRAFQERDWIAVSVRRNSDGEEEQEGEAVEHTKGETRDLCRHTLAVALALEARRAGRFCLDSLYQCRSMSLSLRSTRALASWEQVPQRLGLQAGRAFSARSCTASVA